MSTEPHPRSDGPGPASPQGDDAAGLHNVAELARRWLDCRVAVVRVSDAHDLFAAALSEEGAEAIDDAGIDPRDLSDPLTADDHGFRFYAGIPLRTSGDRTVGVLAALDLKPRELTAGDLEMLNLLAAVASELAEARFSGRR